MDTDAPPKIGLIARLRAYYRPASRALGLAAFGLLCLSAYLFKPAPKPTLLDEAFYVLIAGGLTFWLALYLNRSRRPDPGTIDRRGLSVTNPSVTYLPSGLIYVRPNLILILLGIAALLALIEINTGIFGIEALRNATSTVQFGLFIAGLVGITLGYGCVRFPRRFRARRSPHTADTQESPIVAANQSSLSPIFQLITHNSLLITIILLAFALRAVALGSAVHHLVDEIHFTNATFSLRPPDNTVKLLWPINTITAFPWLFSYMQAWGVGLLGRNLEGLRAISVIMGTLGIPALYFLARELFDRKTALLAALLLAVFPPHIQFSRIGLNNIIDPLFGTLALAFLVRGFKYKRPLDFALGGAALGLTQYFYEGGRLLFPALILLSLAWFILVKPRFYPEAASSDSADSSSSFSGNWKLETGGFPLSFSSLATFLLPALLIALPVYITLAAIRQPFDARFQTVGVGGSYWVRVTQLGRPQTIEEHLTVPFLVYTYQPEIALYYGGEQAMLLPYVVPFVFIGVLSLLAYWRTAGVIVVGWVLLGSMGNMLLTESAIYARYVVVFPALMLLTAVGIRTLAVLLWPVKSRWRTAFVLLVTAVLSIGQVTYFFGPHLARYNEQLRQNFDSEDAIFRSTNFPWGTQVHVIEANTIGQVYLSGLANYLSDGLTVFVTPPADLNVAYVSALSHSIDQAFYIEPYDEPSLMLLKQYFMLEGPYTSPYNVPPYRQLMLYYARATVPAG